MRIKATLGAILRAFGSGYLARRGATDRQYVVMKRIAACRTSVLGGHEYRCDSCGRTAIARTSSRS